MNDATKLLIYGLIILLSMMGILVAPNFLQQYSTNVLSMVRLILFFIWIYGATMFIGELL